MQYVCVKEMRLDLHQALVCYSKYAGKRLIPNSRPFVPPGNLFKMVDITERATGQH